MPEPPPPPPTRDDPAVNAEASARRKRLLAQKGRSSTILSAPVAVTPESNEIVSGSQNRKRALAGAAGRRANILTSSSGVLGDANVGKTLLGS